MYYMHIILQTLHSVCRIADVLMSLQQVGNVKYTGWVLLVPCSSNDGIINALQLQARIMEEELQVWKETVNSARRQFYELNYYTTIQLLTLRKELGAHKIPGRASGMSPYVLVLLQSISLQVTSDNVCEVVKQVTSEQTTGSSKSEELPILQAAAINTVSQLQDEVMASADVQSVDSTQSMIFRAMPTLTETDLTPQQKEILAFVVTRIECSKLLVLKAFEECRGKEMDRYDIVDWCNNNNKNYKFEEEDGDSAGEESDLWSLSSDDSESEYDEQGFEYSPGSVYTVHVVKDA